jgi:hypothetical protein
MSASGLPARNYDKEISYAIEAIETCAGITKQMEEQIRMSPHYADLETEFGPKYKVCHKGGESLTEMAGPNDKDQGRGLYLGILGIGSYSSRPMPVTISLTSRPDDFVGALPPGTAERDAYTVVHALIYDTPVAVALPAVGAASAPAPPDQPPVTTPPPEFWRAERILEQAEAKAKALHLKIFLVYENSSGRGCSELRAFMLDPKIQPILQKSFVLFAIEVGEGAKGSPELGNPGGSEMMAKHAGRGFDSTLPFVTILDENGRQITNSLRPVPGKNVGENIGYPTSPQEIDWFMQMLKKSAPSMTSRDAGAVENWLRQNAHS